jgi:hypothetical protein
MLAGQVMELDLSLLKFALSRVESSFVQGFHCIGNIGVDIDGSVDNAICANTQYASELQTVREQ